ncbi:hypothetical protein VM1G_04789 [Cytospora mali]|uniref:Uncharacterized protein n=1 Tax=Cytospora mali TaxID=578113 RepID=A0A194VZN9_CYTMA|nr:hypothetical protein VM1G_04789 [Valsa mali]
MSSLPRSLPIALALAFTFMGYMMGTSSAVNLLFFGPGDNCYASTDHIGCYNHPGDACCYASSPFCTTFQLGDTGDNLASIWAMSGKNCNLKNGYSTCSQHGSGHTDCCIDIFGHDTSTCSAFWGMNLGGGKDEVTADANATNGECVQPNKMVYKDGNGIKEIFLPNGTLEKAVDSYKKKDYAALAGYSAWVDVMGNDTDSQST